MKYIHLAEKRQEINPSSLRASLVTAHSSGDVLTYRNQDSKCPDEWAIMELVCRDEGVVSCLFTAN